VPRTTGCASGPTCSASAGTSSLSPAPAPRPFAERRGKRARWRRGARLRQLRELRPDLAGVLDDLAGDHDDQAVLVVGEWSFAGGGRLCEGDRALANAAAAQAREYRDLVREELRCA